MAFTHDNTEGYSDEELAALNAGLRRRLAAIDPDDVEARQQAEKAYADEMSGFELAREAYHAAAERARVAPRRGFAATPELRAALEDCHGCLARMIEAERALS